MRSLPLYRRVLLLGLSASTAVAAIAIAAGYVIGQSGAGPALQAVVVTVIVVWGTAVAVLVSISLGLNELTTLMGVQISANVGGALSLGRLFQGEILPPLGDSALSPAAAGRLVSLVTDHRPSQIVELGAGSSTVWIARLLTSIELRSQVLSVEHDQDFVRIVQRSIDEFQPSNERLKLLHCPLRPTGGTKWYDAEILHQALDGPIDFLIVDGPPDPAGEGIRAAALPSLAEDLRPGAIIFVDDTSRHAEASMVQEWLGAFPDLHLVVRGYDHSVLQWKQ